MYRTTELSLGRMLLGLLVLLLFSGFTTAHPAKRNETADPMEGYCPKDTTYGINVFENSSDPTGPMKNCDCLDDPWVPPPSSLPFPQKRSTSNADAAAVKDPSFLDSLIQQGSDIMANITWGYGDLAFNVSVLIQNPGCTGGDYSDIANCASGLFWVQFDRPLGPEKCPVPDGGLKVSKQQWNDWANAAKGSW